MKIGIDFSINSPSITIYDQDTYRFISLFNCDADDFTKSKKYETHQKLQPFIQMIPYKRKIDKTDYQTEQTTKLNDAIFLAETILHSIKSVVVDEVPIIGIEGFSYGSKSASYIDLIFYQSVLRYKLSEEFGADNIRIISPTEIKKKFSGKGNANKMLMIDTFVEKFGDLFNQDLIDIIKSTKESKIKPIDDIVDSFAIIKSI